MASTFDDISEPSTEVANDEFSYRRNSKLQNWITDTFSSSYNLTVDKFEKYKRYFLCKWKIILFISGLWLSVLIPVVILWHELKDLRIHALNKEEIQVIKEPLKMVQYEEEEITMSSQSTDNSFYVSSSTSSTMNIMDIESLLDEKLAILKDQLQCACSPGMKGETGAIGLPGLDGLPGIPGLSMKGDKGEIGLLGPQGPPGFMGIKGETGRPGLNGPKGEKGDMGLASEGMKGVKGEQGVPGPPGLQGWPGPKGDRGSRYFGR